jgi:hypothetical protein
MMKRRRFETAAVELNNKDKEWETYMALGRRQSKKFFDRVAYGQGNLALSMVDALALSYLHGVFHGWDVKERHDKRQLEAGPEEEYILGLS